MRRERLIRPTGRCECRRRYSHPTYIRIRNSHNPDTRWRGEDGVQNHPFHRNTVLLKAARLVSTSFNVLTA